MSTHRPAGPILTAVIAALSRIVDEAPVFGLLAIAVLLITQTPNASMTQTIVGDIVSGLLGYMQGAKSNRSSPPTPPAPPPAA